MMGDPNLRYEHIRKKHTKNDVDDCDTCQMLAWYEQSLNELGTFQSMLFLASKEGQIFCATVDGVDVYLVTKDKLKNDT